MTRKKNKILHILFLGIGAYLLFFLIKKIGISTIVENIGQIGWAFVPLLFISFSWYVFYALAWFQFLSKSKGSIHFWELFRIKIAGEAVNTLTPANFIGGDPMRIYLLKRYFPVTESAASVVVDRTLHSMATLFMVFFGVIVSFLSYDHFPSNVKFGIPLVMLVAMGFIGFIFVHQRRGIFGLLLQVLKKTGIKKEFSQKTVDRFQELDEHIVSFYQESHRGFMTALGFHIAGRLLGVLEVYVVGKTITNEFSLFIALVLTALSPMINTVFTFVPGALGVMEGAYSGVLYLMGLDPALGITIQIAKRIRAAFWIALGIAFLNTRDRTKVWEEKELIEKV
ncbi:MAG: hypothetical protein COX62_08030 [Deltaproteobacteria bacterium CG_4_10_14_0_2_um_filter_43_8]|nr:MAG: hypothetical protein COV43_06520 [Deltaproteobacteria bacterium CG11_big_fil_rev_8_21_14_0_20_42_23]PJA18822.1 MAG: hypothetical protein COX62_08030 [Deltaproteobacteria bacterium CG_4_10_14_0_2_um_filter_43_8]PJC64842.1 MAG: hypothetical protein CO021_02160 [Deltaproteobacteria bacterium CG_4_9_14_0_2_um_filter_42_21]